MKINYDPSRKWKQSGRHQDNATGDQCQKQRAISGRSLHDQNAGCYLVRIILAYCAGAAFDKGASDHEAV